MGKLRSLSHKVVAQLAAYGMGAEEGQDREECAGASRRYYLVGGSGGGRQVAQQIGHVPLGDLWDLLCQTRRSYPFPSSLPGSAGCPQNSSKGL